MAAVDNKISKHVATTVLDDTDLLYILKNPDTTSDDRKLTGADLKSSVEFIGTEGSIPFVDVDGTLTEDNAHLFWNNVANSLLAKGHLAVGDQGIVDNSSLLYPGLTSSNAFGLQEAVTTELTGFDYTVGGMFHQQLDPTANATAFAMGLDVELFTKTGNTKNLAPGVDVLFFKFQHNGTGSVGSVTGVDGFIYTYGGPISSAIGIFSNLYGNGASANITNGRGAYVQAGTAAGASIGTMYGFESYYYGTINALTTLYGWDQTVGITVSGMNNYINYADRFIVDATGALHVTTNAPASVVSAIKGAAAQSADLTQWQDSSSNVLSAVDSLGAWHPPELTNAAAQNDSYFYSSTDSALSYKDPSGVVHNLY